jgi:hypothetical protein
LLCVLFSFSFSTLLLQQRACCVDYVSLTRSFDKLSTGAVHHSGIARCVG